MTPSEDVACLLVVGDDGSAMSDLVWAWLEAHAWLGWRVEVMTADESKIVWGEPPRVAQWSPDWARAKPAGSDGVSHLQFTGDPRPMLGDRSDADLIVVGRSSRQTGYRPLGGTTEWLIHHPPAPIVVVGGATTVDTATLCVDGSDHARAALAAFTSLPLAAGAGVTVLIVADGRVEAEASAAQAVGSLTGKVASVSTMVVPGLPTPAILNHLDNTRPDLVVLGTKGLTGWKRLLLGSTAGAVVRGARCNALVASAGEA